MIEATRTRLLTAGGSLLAATGLAAAMVAGPALAEDTSNATATAEVENTIEIATADLDVNLTGAPGAELEDSGSITVKSNSMSGYSVDVAADSAAFEGADAENNDTISVSELTVGTTALDASADPGPLSHTVATGTSTGEAGVEHTVDYDMTMPWVNADTYTVGLTYTATNNS